MTLAFIIYLIQSVFPAIKGAFLLGGILLLICIPIGHMRNDIYGKSEGVWIFPRQKRWYITFILCFLFAGLIPNKETSYAMIAAYAVETVVTNQKVQDFAGNSVKVLEKYMKDYLNEDQNKETKN